MYAVIETGGKQYRVEVGTELEVEALDAEPGNTITLDRVLLVADGDEASIGRPLVADAAVSAEVLRRDRGEKLISFKYRPKARTRVKKGHRQELTILRISDITLNGKSAAKESAKADKDAAAARKEREAAAAKQAEADAALASTLAVGAETETAEATPAKKASTRATTKSKTADAAETEAPSASKRTSTKRAKASAETTESEADSDADTATKKPARRTKKDE
jgi:large subunit ribosomal protein L21